MEQTKNNDFDEIELFTTPVYVGNFLEDVETVKKVAEDKIYHTEQTTLENSKMSGSFFHDERIFDFAKSILQSSWDILDRQGHLMENYQTVYESMWLQTHAKNSYMPQHTHSGNNQLVGFYFLEVPEQSTQLLLHDPRIGKTQINLDEKDITQLTNASLYTVLNPQVGQLILTPAWLAHSFTPNQSNSPVKFVHINIQAVRVDYKQAPELPIII